MRAVVMVFVLMMSACCSASAPAPTPEPEPEAQATCDARLADAAAHWSSVREANLACAVDAECALAFTGTQCRGACQVSVNAAGAPLLEGAVKEADAQFCSSYQSDGCPFATPKCALGEAFCNAGACDVRYPPR